MSDDIDQTLNNDNDQTNPKPPEFDFSNFPYNSLFHERREGAIAGSTKHPLPSRKSPSPAAPSRAARQERPAAAHRSHDLRQAVYRR